MRGWSGRTRAISRKTVSPPTPLSKMPMADGRSPLAVTSLLGERPTANGELFRAVRPDTRTALSFDSVLLDLLVEVRPRRVDRLRGLGDVPAVLAQFREDERFLCFVLEVLQLGKMHRAADDLRGGAEEFGRQIGNVDRVCRHHDHQPLDHVAQLADVAAPLRVLQCAQRGGRELLLVLVVILRKERREMLRKNLDVMAPLVNLRSFVWSTRPSVVGGLAE